MRPPPRLLEPLEPRTLLAAIAWDGGAGTLSWHDAPNWSTNTLPGPADDVTINVPGATPTITHAAGVTTSIRSLVCNEFFALSAGTLATSVQWRQNGPMTMTGGAITGAGNLVVNAGLTWTGGTMSGAGKTQILPTGTLTVAPATNVTLARDLVNNGTLKWTGGSIRFVDAILTNLAGRTFNVQSGGGTLVSVSGTNTIDNKGTLRRNGTSASASTLNVRLNNSGTVEAKQGQLILNGSGTSTAGSMVALAGATLRFGGVGVPLGYTVGANSTLSGAGTFTFHTVEHRIYGPLSALGRLQVGGAPAVIVQGAGSSVLTLVLTAGELSVLSSIDVGAALLWTGGKLGGGGTVRVASGGLLTISGGATKVLGATLRSETAGSWSEGPIEFAWGRFENLGSFDAYGSVIWSSTGSTNAIVNAGTFTKRAGTSELALDSDYAEMGLVNTGTVRVEAGALRLDGGGSNSGEIVALSASSALTIGDRPFTLSAGSIRGPFASIDLDGPVTWTGGALGAPGTQLTVHSGWTLTIQGAVAKHLDCDLLNEGTIAWRGVLDPSGITIDNDGRIEVSVGAGATGGAATLLNRDRLVKTGVGAVSFVSSQLQLDNPGEVTVEEGTLHLLASRVSQVSGSTLTGGEWEVEAGGALDLQTAHIQVNEATVRLGGGYIYALAGLRENRGTVELSNDAAVMVTPSGGTLVNSGIVKIVGGCTLQVQGNLQLASASRVNVGDATGLGPQGVVLVSGSASLGGAIGAGLASPASIGQMFTVLTAGSVSGSFASEVYVVLVPGLDLEAQRVGNTAVLTVIPE